MKKYLEVYQLKHQVLQEYHASPELSVWLLRSVNNIGYLVFIKSPILNRCVISDKDFYLCLDVFRKYVNRFML